LAVAGSGNELISPMRKGLLNREYLGVVVCKKLHLGLIKIRMHASGLRVTKGTFAISFNKEEHFDYSSNSQIQS
jgi:hypothetical protein